MSDEDDFNEFELRKEIKDPKRKWADRIVKSIKIYYKKCPYFDLHSSDCFIMEGGRGGKCPRDGKYEGCPVLEAFLVKRYDEIKAKGKTLPYDFRDLALV